MSFQLTPQAINQIRTGLRGLAKEIVDEHVAKIRYSHQRGLSCTCGEQKARYERDPGADDFSQNGGPMSAAAVAQVVEALRPVLRTMVQEMVPAPPKPQTEDETPKPFFVKPPAGLPQAPDELAATYAREAARIVHERRERGEKADYGEELRRLCYQHRNGDKSREFQLVKDLAEMDVAKHRREAQLAEVTRRVTHLERTGATGKRRERFAKEAGDIVHAARERGERVSYGDALRGVYAKAGIPVPV